MMSRGWIQRIQWTSHVG